VQVLVCGSGGKAARRVGFVHKNQAVEILCIFLHKTQQIFSSASGPNIIVVSAPKIYNQISSVKDVETR
jgi:hypothetical protein